MRNLFSIGVVLLLICKSAISQDFSNRGTDFWTGYGPHEKISSGVSDMTLYFTSDDTATVTIYIGNTLFQTLSLLANSITASNNIPESGTLDARLQNETVYVNKGIYIHSTSPVVAYAQIWGSKVTATTILFPVKTLGRTYTALNYTQISNTSGMRSYAFVVATENNTTVEVKPSVATSAGLAAGVWTSRTLNKGDVWLIKGGTDATDLTGTQIRSVASGTNTCKPIAVFSGSQKISVTCTTNSSSGDNFFQQCFPMAAWGRKYVSSPTAGLNYSNNVYRVMINPDSTSTVVKVNGVTLPAAVTGLSPAVTPLTPGVVLNRTSNLYYEFVSGAPVKIEASSPVMVAQYISNKTNCGNNYSNIGDPDMIYLSPVEQTIDSIIVSPVPTENNDAINYLNINMKTVDVPNFSIRNQLNAVVPITFTPMTIDPTYSYAQVSLAAGYASNIFYKLKSTSGGFNAIAYGYAQSESYAYNAGTNVRNLNHFLTSANPLGDSSVTKVCKGTPTTFSVTLPYIPTSISLNFNGNANISPNAAVTVNAPAVDSFYVSDGTPLYVFHIPGQFAFNATGLYSIAVTSVNPSPDGCNGVENWNFDVLVIGGPLANFNWTFSGCASNPVIFHDLSTDTLHAIQTWQWSFGTIGTSNLQSPTFTFGAGGTYNVGIRVINEEGCYDDSTKVFTIDNSPTASFTFSGTSCVGNTLSFTDQSTITNGTITHWYWNFADGTRDTFTVSTNPTHVYQAAGVYDVILIVENANGCRHSDTVSVTVGNRPVPDFTLPGNICLPGGSALFSNTSTVLGGGVMTYSWNFGDASPLSTLINPSHLYNATGPFSVTLTASLGTCSKDTTKIFNTLYQKPVAAFNVNAENCLNTATVFTDASTSVNSTITSWSWNFGDGGTATIQNPTHTYSTAGIYTIKLIVVTDKGCVDSTIHSVTVNALPVADFTISTPLCATQVVTFTSTSTSAAGNIVEWNWNFGDGNSTTTTNANPVTHTYNTANNYTITLTVKTDRGCISTLTSHPVVIHPMPTVNFTYPSLLCAPGDVQFTNASVISDGTSLTYSWNFGDASTPSTLTSPLHTYNAGGNFTVVLTATSSNGCMKSANHALNMLTLPAAGFTVRNTGNICSNTSLDIVNTSTVTGNGSVDKIEVFWDYQNDPTIKTTDNSPVANGNYSHNYPVFGSPLIKVVRVLIRATNGTGCTKDYYQDLSLHAAPNVVFNVMSPVCQEVNTIALTAANNSTSLTGTGIYSGDGIATSPNFSPATAGVGNHTITYTFTGTNGCISSATGVIRVNPTPRVDYGPDRNVLEGNTISLVPLITSGTGLRYLWTPGLYLNSVSLAGPNCTPRDDINYTITVRSGDGCVNTDDIFVKVVKDFIVPNTFTPNGDGINDTWVIENLSLYPDHSVRIFTRYGQQIFELKDFVNGWDGTYKGKPLPSGTYYYIIDLKGARETKRGYVTIIR